MPVPLFSLLQTPLSCPKITSGLAPVHIPPRAPAGGYKEWDSFSSELQQFLSALYSQPDSGSILSELPVDQLCGGMNQQAASAKLYASLVIAVQELSEEYRRRVQAGAKLHLSLYRGALVLHGTLGERVLGPKHPCAANAVKGYVLVERSELLAQDKLEENLLDRVAGYMNQRGSGSEGYALLTSLDRTWFCKLTSEDELMTACVTHDAQQSSPTFLQAFFYFMHLILQQPQVAPTCRKRKLDQLVPESSENKQAAHRSWEQFQSLRKIMMVLCRFQGFRFQEIEKLVTLQLPVAEIMNCYNEEIYVDGRGGRVFRGVYKGAKAIFKTVDIVKAPDKMKTMVREVWVMQKLEKFQGDVIPRLYACGYLDGGVWVTILEDLGQSANKIDRDSRVESNIKSAVAWLHGENVIHGDANLGNFIVGKDGKVMFIDLERTCLFEDGDVHPDDFLHLALQDWKMLATWGIH